MAKETILDLIMRHKRSEVARRRRERPLALVREEAERSPPPRDLAAALRRPGVSLIAEVKRASPSKGAISPHLDAAALAQAYERGGAAAISVLTDERFFAGSLADLQAVRGQVGVPVLRKDFVLDPYQVYEARAAGADAVLLIVAALDDRKLHELYCLTCALGMSALVEVHDEGELGRALALRPRIVGINNRDLHSFTVNLEMTIRLRPLIPDGILVVSESGISTPTEVARLASADVDGMLVGESLVRASDPVSLIRSLLAASGMGRTSLVQRAGTSPHVHVKICGLTTLEDARCAAEAGADLLGFVFYPPSPRYIAPERAAEIAHALRYEFGARVPQLVGVFVNESEARVRSIINTVGLDLVQLHGDEPPEQVCALRPFAFKALRPRSPEGAREALARYAPAFSDDPTVPQLLVDAYHPQKYGGTGCKADLETARALAGRSRLLLAGGLTPENVGAAVACVRPWGVDVSGGVERSKGRKDHALIRDFVQAARAGAADAHYGRLADVRTVHQSPSVVARVST